MIDLTNIIEINNQYGRELGDEVIHTFSEMLHLVAAGQCFIGRNGGNKFITLFENCDRKQLSDFLERFNQEIQEANEKKDLPQIKYEYGVAFHGEDPEEADVEITDLIAYANNRIYEKSRR